VATLAAAGNSGEEADSLDLRLRRDRVFLTGISSVISVDRVTSDVPTFEGRSRLDVESLDLLRRGFDSPKVSGVPLSQASKRFPTGFVGGVSAAGTVNGVAASSWVLGYDLRLFLREGFWWVVTASSPVCAPWLLGRRRRLRSRSSSLRGEVILLSSGDVTALSSSYSTVTIRLGSSLSAVSDLRACLCGYRARSSADMDPRGDVRARRLLGRILTISDLSFSVFGEVDEAGAPSLFPPLPLPAPLLVGR
jgi:hypothetical protein